MLNPRQTRIIELFTELFKLVLIEEWAPDPPAHSPREFGRLVDPPSALDPRITAPLPNPPYGPQAPTPAELKGPCVFIPLSLVPMGEGNIPVYPGFHHIEPGTTATFQSRFVPYPHFRLLGLWAEEPQEPLSRKDHAVLDLVRCNADGGISLLPHDAEQKLEGYTHMPWHDGNPGLRESGVTIRFGTSLRLEVSARTNGSRSIPIRMWAWGRLLS